MRAFIVSVDYADYLALTLPLNTRHFEDVTVVTVPDDHETRRVAVECGANTYLTDAFTDDDADFNKWKALDEALSFAAPSAWVCVMDADVVWPSEPDLSDLCEGCIHGPYRRMQPAEYSSVTLEPSWPAFPRHQQQRYLAGFTMIFHAGDPVLNKRPWFRHDLTHAGRGDLSFQLKWGPEKRIRLNWDVLHLGEPRRNWCGRLTGRPHDPAREALLRAAIRES